MEKHYGMLQFFSYSHLPPHLQEVSKRFAELAELVPGCITDADQKARELVQWIESGLPTNPEATWAQTKLNEARELIKRFCAGPSESYTVPYIDEILRKVLEAKDCAVRSVLYKTPVST